ncbi:hypothetical protein DFH07DRAFT_967870 [Mycena maculata]|uniref:Shelterin complex subunit TPP1/Est3 domain-containing protein n=1 Tax=Mycena maculata TaxID=230809 RepID=A0AAD7I2V9_9AGAR|nr:hypothetical protein DFH07DRAFT_967870 [Mycena maculata]
MSESIRPWMKTHLVHVAETYGGDLSTVPLEDKSKKVQIVELLTFGIENEDSAVWALISDKALCMPVKFSKEAVVAYNSKNSRSITENRSALVVINKFRPVSTRIPRPTGGMSTEAHLALNCDSVTLVGSLGESKWGNPNNIESEAALKEWSDGLRKDGGAGNVLKERKKAREGNTTECRIPAKRPISPRKPPVIEPKSHNSTSRARQTGNLDLYHEYKKRWHDSIESPLDFVVNFLVEDARDLGSSSPSQKYSVTSSPYSGWSPTPEKSSPLKATGSSPKQSSYLTAPTPAQRRARSPGLSPCERKVARPPPPPPPPVGSGPERILVPNSDPSYSQPSQPEVVSQPQSSPSQSVFVQLRESSRAPVEPVAWQPIFKKEDVDVEMLDEDDAQTHERLFGRAAKVKQNPLDWVVWNSGDRVVNWDRLYSVLRRSMIAGGD